MKARFSFSLDNIYGDQNNREYLLKISCDYFELNILLSKDELLKIPEVVNARWTDRTSLKLGDCLGVPTWWSSDEDEISILVGHDDEGWDFGVGLTKSVLKDLLKEIDVDEKRAK